MDSFLYLYRCIRLRTLFCGVPKHNSHWLYIDDAKRYGKLCYDEGFYEALSVAEVIKSNNGEKDGLEI